MKKGKAPGFDSTPTEIMKGLEESSLEELPDLSTKWWNEEEIEEELQARIVLVYNKGDTNRFENDRPI